MSTQASEDMKEQRLVKFMQMDTSCVLFNCNISLIWKFYIYFNVSFFGNIFFLSLSYRIAPTFFHMGFLKNVWMGVML